jgi:hypothetical protein
LCCPLDHQCSVECRRYTFERAPIGISQVVGKLLERWDPSLLEGLLQGCLHCGGARWRLSRSLAACAGGGAVATNKLLVALRIKATERDGLAVPHLACDLGYGWRCAAVQGLNECQLPTLPPGRFHIGPLGLLHRTLPANVLDIAE